MTTETSIEATQVWKVWTPVKGYNGPTAGVVFRDGYAEVLDLDKARELQEDYGYRVVPPVPKPARPVMTRPAHPSEDAERVFPFFPRDPNLPPGADATAAIPHQSRIVHKATEVTTEITTEMETPNGEDSEVR